MAEQIEKIKNIPHPIGTIEGMRDTGYDFDTALCDIVDNSIDAGATEIDININMDDDGVLITVADNGCGMDRDTLIKGMQYGGGDKDEPKRLGKFGLGLKTASTAFCRKLSAVTRDKPDGKLLKATWDLDHVNRVNEWELLLSSAGEFEKNTLDEVASGSSGTLVVWDKIDRVLRDYEDPTGSYAVKSLGKKTEGFKKHAGMTYQRYLDPDDNRARNIKMILNGEKITPWDPFCQQESGADGTEIVANNDLPIKMPDGKKPHATIKAFVVPHKSDFSTPEAYDEANITTDMEGFYIYRENRLIHHGGFLGMRVPDPHLSLLRIEFSFDHQLDQAFQIDIKKSKIRLEETLYEHIKSKFLPAPLNAADERYRGKNKKIVYEKAGSAHERSNRAISRQEKNLTLSKVTVIDEGSGEIEVENPGGTVRLNIEILDSADDNEVVVKPVENLKDGVLWSTAIIDEHHAVLLNTGHDFYNKVYVPNLSEGVVVQGMDSLLWAFVEAELGTINEATKDHFENMKIEVSRLLRKLVKDLPDPEIETES